MWVLSCIPRHIEEYRKLQKLKMAPHLLATNESVIVTIWVLYIAAAMKNHMVDWLFIGYILIGGTHETA